MAAPTVQRRTGQRPPASRFMLWLQRLGAAVGRPLFAVLLAMIAGGIVILLTTPGTIDDRFSSMLAAFQALFAGSFGDFGSLSDTLVRVGPLILTGISVSIAYRAGLFNIGAAGQLAIGATTAGAVAFAFQGLPGWLLIPLMIIVSLLAGALWGGIVGILKAWRGAHEVVTTIMLNWVAFYFTDFLITGPLKAPNQPDQSSPLPPQATLPRIAVFYNNTLGNLFGKIPNAESYLIDVSFFVVLLALVIYWFITARTTFGYEIRVIGQNPKAARYAGIPIKRNLFYAMALAGAFAGLAGALRLMGQFPYTLIGGTFAIDPTGFDAIGVSLLGRTSAIGILFAGLLFGGLRQGGGIMQLSAGVPGDLVYIIQALVLFSIAAEFLPAIQRALPRFARLGRRPELVPSIGGIVSTEPALLTDETAETSSVDGLADVPEAGRTTPVREES